MIQMPLYCGSTIIQVSNFELDGKTKEIDNSNKPKYTVELKD
jgi:hypothetical protein